MAHRIVDETSLKTVADAIREKAGTSDSLAFPTGFAEAIAGIQAGGGGGEISINGCKVVTGEYVSAEDLQTGTTHTIFSESISLSKPVASLFYASDVFVYNDKPFLSATGGGLLTSKRNLSSTQTGYNINGASVYLSGGFAVTYMNGKLTATLDVSSDLRVPAGKKYQWIVLYQ